LVGINGNRLLPSLGRVGRPMIRTILEKGINELCRELLGKEEALKRTTSFRKILKPRKRGMTRNSGRRRRPKKKKGLQENTLRKSGNH